MEKISWDDYERQVRAFRAKTDQLEVMVERDGLKGIMDMLVTVCSEKADHIRSSFDDEATAKKWERDSKTLDAVRSKLVTG